VIRLLVEIELLKFFDRRTKTKLYRQWVERAGLPPDAITPQPNGAEHAPAQIDEGRAVSPKASGPVQVLPSSSAVTHAEVAGDMMAETDKRRPRLRILYILLGLSMVILCGALVLLTVQSC